MTGAPKVSVVEYGVGNLGSVLHTCRRAGIETQIARDGQELERQHPDRILLPGVGAIGEALFHLRDRGFEPSLNRMALELKTPLLGICVGMQMLAEECEEFGLHKGLGWLTGATTKRLAPKGSGLRLPHIGWNTARFVSDHALCTGIQDEHFYFVHSFAVDCAEHFHLATTEYGKPFVSAVRRDNIVGVQFHPEKSGVAGVALLKNFAGASAC